MKKLILIALAVSIITGFAVFQFASSLQNGPGQKTQAVVVATKTIPKGTIIMPEMVTTRQVPVDLAHPQSIANAQDIVGRISKETIEADEQVLTSRLSDVNQENNSLSYAVPANYRAVTIQTDEVVGVAGYLTKGDHVDVVATALTGVTQYVVENVEILAVGSTATNKSGEDYTSVTISVPVAEVPKLSCALTPDVDTGLYRLVLRSPVDNGLAGPAPYTP